MPSCAEVKTLPPTRCSEATNCIHRSGRQGRAAPPLLPPPFFFPLHCTTANSVCVTLWLKISRFMTTPRCHSSSPTQRCIASVWKSKCFFSSILLTETRPQRKTEVWGTKVFEIFSTSKKKKMVRIAVAGTTTTRKRPHEHKAYVPTPVFSCPHLSISEVHTEFTIIALPVSNNQPRAILLVYSWAGWWAGGGMKGRTLDTRRRANS